MNNAMLNFKGQFVLITGSTRGIGKTTAEKFRSLGAYLIITGTSEECPESLKQEWGQGFSYLCADFTKKTGIHKFLEELAKFSRIDVCVNNAGINRLDFLDDIKDEDYEAMLSINLNAPLMISRQIAGLMKKQGYGRIVNIASIWGTITKPKRTLYSVTKNAIVGLSRSMAVELAEFGIMVNAVSPGFTMTELTIKNLSDSDIASLSQEVPARRFAEPSEISNVIVFLCSKENSYLTGQNIIVDGGFTNV
jgi:3-oxoacyl-[acyl-carrier protein] reductase